MILATVRMAIPPQKRDEALKILRLMAAHCRVRPNCLSCRIYEDVQEQNVFMFEGRCKSQEDLERHLRSDEYHKVLLVMEMALRQPEIRFDTILGSTGIETVEKARSSGGRGG
jgi:quinol monooxygenase YgiN